MRSRSGTVTPTSNNVGIAPQVIQVKGVDNKLVQIIMDEIVEGGAKVRWSDIAGQEVNLLRGNYFVEINMTIKLKFSHQNN